MRKYLYWLSVNLLIISLAPSQVIHRKNFDRFTVYRITDWITYAPADRVTSIDIGQEFAYIGTRKGGILRYDLFSGKWKYPYTTGSGLRSNHIIRVVYNYHEDRIYALTNKGIDVYNEAFNYWEPANRNELPDRRKPSNEDIRDFHARGGYDYPPFYRPKNSELPDFFTDRDYLYRLDGELLDRDNTIFNLTDRVTDQFRRIWLGTNGAGITIGDLNTLNLTVKRRSIPDVSMRDILFDGKNMWTAGIGRRSEQSGIGLWDRKKDIWQYYRAGFNLDIYNDNIRVISPFKNRIYFGSEGGLLVFDKKKELWKTITQHAGLQSDIINDLYEFDNMLFIATENGFNWIDVGTGINSPRNTILNGTEIFKISSFDSLLLLATSSGVYTFSPKTEEIKLFNIRASLPDHNISAIKHNNNELWIAGAAGIVYLDAGSNKWYSYPDIRQYIKGRIHDIEFTKKHVWFATDNGLLEYDRNSDYWYLYTKKDGLPNNKIFHIDKNKKELWLSTAGGAVVFQHKRLEKLDE